MPDIISRIRLEAQGADQVAREIGKIKDAYDDTASSAQDLTRVSVGGAADPFTRATQPGGGGAENVVMRSERTRLENENYNRRMAEHYRPSQGRGAFQQTMQAARLGGGTVGAVESADPMGAVQGGGGILGLLKGMNPILLGLGAVLGVSLNAIRREFSMVREQYGAGMPQRLGADYASSRWFQIRQAREGIPLGMLSGMMESFGGAGGAYDERYMGTQAEVMARYGIDPGTMGQTMATMQRVNRGFTQEGEGRMTGERNLQLLATTFGVGRVSPAMQGIAQILEDAMARGATKGSAILQGGFGGIAREVAGYSQFGGLSMEGALGLAAQRRERAAGGARPQSALDVMTIRAIAAETGEDLFTIQERIARNPDYALAFQQRILRRVSGGRREVAGRLIMGQDFAPNLAGILANQALGIGQGALGYGKAIPTDVMAQTATKLAQLMLTHGMGVESVKLITDAYNAFMAGGDIGAGYDPAAHLRGKPAPEKIDKESERLLEQTQKSGPLSEEDFKTDAEGKARTGAEQLSTFFDLGNKQETANELLEEQRRLLESIDSKTGPQED